MSNGRNKKKKALMLFNRDKTKWTKKQKIKNEWNGWSFNRKCKLLIFIYKGATELLSFSLWNTVVSVSICSTLFSFL